MLLLSLFITNWKLRLVIDARPVIDTIFFFSLVSRSEEDANKSYRVPERAEREGFYGRTVDDADICARKRRDTGVFIAKEKGGN